MAADPTRIDIAVADVGDAAAVEALLKARRIRKPMQSGAVMQACEEGDVYVARRYGEQALLGLLMFDPTLQDSEHQHRERFTLLVAAGWKARRIAENLLGVALVHRGASAHYESRVPAFWTTEVNRAGAGQQVALRAAGFSPVTSWRSWIFRSARTFRCELTSAIFDQAIIALHDFMVAGSTVRHGRERIEFHFSPTLIDFESLQAQVDWLRRTHRGGRVRSEEAKRQGVKLGTPLGVEIELPFRHPALVAGLAILIIGLAAVVAWARGG